MLLRILLTLIKPSSKQLKNIRNQNWFVWFTSNVYMFMLQELQKSYLHYAISDTILMDNGRIKIVHEFRDTEFENELKRNGIDIRPHLHAATFPFNVQKSARNIWYGYFRFKNRLSVYVDDKELFIMHDSSFSVSGTASTNVKKSSSSDIIKRCIIELKTNRIQKPHQGSSRVMEDIVQKDVQPVESNEKNKKTATISQKPRRGNIFGKDTIPTHKTKPAEAPQESTKSVAEVIEKKGFEIDTSF